MAYPCDLPANMGNTDIFRAIYAKLDNIQPGTHIEEKLDEINNNIELNRQAIENNTRAIQDISINVNVNIGDLASHIDKVSHSIDVLNSSLCDVIKNISPGPAPGPFPPHPHPHPHPVPPPPPIEPDVIFYPVEVELPPR